MKNFGGVFLPPGVRTNEASRPLNCPESAGAIGPVISPSCPSSTSTSGAIFFLSRARRKKITPIASKMIGRKKNCGCSQKGSMRARVRGGEAGGQSRAAQEGSRDQEPRIKG